MTLEDLQAQAMERFGGSVFVRVQAMGWKTVAVCGVAVPGGPKKKGYEKTVSFNAASIPDDALDKIQSVMT